MNRREIAAVAFLGVLAGLAVLVVFWIGLETLALLGSLELIA